MTAARSRPPAEEQRPLACPHIPPWTIKWGIASGAKWCTKCEKFVYASIDFEGHP